MKVEIGIWQRLTKVVVFLLGVAAILAVIVWYLPVIRHNEGMRREILRIEGRVKEEEEKGKRLKSEIEAIRTDPRTVERLARERMSYARSNETVIRFEPVQRTRP